MPVGLVALVWTIIKRTHIDSVMFKHIEQFCWKLFHFLSEYSTCIPMLEKRSNVFVCISL